MCGCGPHVVRVAGRDVDRAEVVEEDERADRAAVGRGQQPAHHEAAAEVAGHAARGSATGSRIGLRAARAAQCRGRLKSRGCTPPRPPEPPMSLKCGIVGLPNVGKSTLFNALTKAGIAAENYPFCTIEPNVGIVELPDPRLAQLAGDRQARAIVPAIVEFVDIAGLVAGASQGRRPGQPVPRPHPRDRRDRQRRALLRGRERHPRRRQGRPGLRHRGDPDRAVPGRPGDGREDAARATVKAAKSGNDKEAKRAGRRAREVPAPRSTRRGRCAASPSARKSWRS